MSDWRPLAPELPAVRARAPRLRRAAAARGLRSACGTRARRTPQPPACPSALILQGAERTASYARAPSASPDALRYLAVVTNLASACRYGEEGVDVDLAFDLIVERGPALAGDAVELTYFVATIGPDEADPLQAAAELRDRRSPPTRRSPASREQLTAAAAGGHARARRGLRLYLGFQLDDAELQQRLQPLLR